jgi:hypothetical protein
MCCVTKASCLTLSTFKNYEKKPIEPELGIMQERGGILKETKP